MLHKELLLSSPKEFRINVSKTGQGTVTVKPLAKYGEVVTVTASPSKGYELSSVTASGVTLSGSGNTRTFTMPAKDVTIAAAFVEVVYELTVGFGMEYGNEYVGYVNEGGEVYGSMNKIPYWQQRNWYLTGLYVFAYARDSEYPDRLTYITRINTNSEVAPASASLTFKDGVTIQLTKDYDYSGNQYEKLKKHIGEVATVKFSTTPDGYL